MRKHRILYGVAILTIVVIAISMKVFRMYGNVHRKLDNILNNQQVILEREESLAADIVEKEVEQVVEEIAEENIVIENKESVIKDALNLIEQQKKIDEELLKELQSGEYTFENPFVILDPYNISPLTALVLFETEEPAMVSLSIENQTGFEEDGVTVAFDTEGYVTEHVVPVYGLFPDSENHITIMLEDETGQMNQSIISIQTEPLISDLQNITFIANTRQGEKYQPGFNFCDAGLHHAGVKKAFDSQGNIRWYFSQTFRIEICNYIQSPIGHVFMRPIPEDQDLIYEMDFLGKIYAVYYDAFQSHHYLELTDHNTMILPVSDKETIEDCLVEIDLSTGEQIHFLDYKDILPRTRNAGAVYNNIDWMHMNSAVAYQGDVIVSSNWQSAIIRNDWDGNIKWMLASPAKWYDIWKDKLLKPVGNNFEYPYNQHAVDVLPDFDNNPDTVDLIVFDNGISRNFVNKEESDAPLYSRMVHYRVNEVEMTVEQIWEFGSGYPELFSRYRGNADLLENGNFLGTFNQETEDGIPCDTVYIEVDKDKNIVWECYAASRLGDNAYQDHRMVRMPIYRNASYIELGIDAKNYIPQEVLDNVDLQE